ncbi:MAG: hypothetical protein LC662_12785 [Rhodothermaceae bacterium]|nr:hypothetical protein [Rhodothermaceae bacterium]
MAVPKIICGPILRRVTKRKVSVWLACSRNYHLELKLYEGDNVKVTAHAEEVSATEALSIDTVAPAEAVTVRFGQNLWIAVVTAETILPLLPGRTYSYNIILTDSDEPLQVGFDFRTEGLLQDDAHEGRPQKAIGYDKDKLPTFVLPADDPVNLFIAHASCRKMHGHGLDALAHLDDIIKKAATGTTVDPFARPQQLYLTGDQLYADDVPGILLINLGVNEGETLVGDETVRIRLDNNSPIETVDADIISFPPFLRSHLMRTYAGFTSGSDRNHLISFEDFAGAYLNYWNIRSWQLDFYKEIKKVIDENKYSVAEGVADRFLEHTVVTDKFGLLPLIEQDRGNAAKFVFNEELNEMIADTAPDGKFAKWKNKVKKAVAGEVKHIADFVSVLPQVSRVLANVPVYMIMDDHEVTDDWNLSKRWQNQVMSKPLGRDVVRNALMAYTVFQDWGNVPDEYVAIGHFGEDETALSAKTLLIRKISDYGHTIATRSGINSIEADTITPIENLLGMGVETGDISWHFEVDTGPTKSFVLDTRTKRHFPSLNSPPGLISKDAIGAQLPDFIPFGNAPFTFVISPAPVLALQSFEEVIQPLASSVIGITATTSTNPGILQGRLEYDFESWGFNSEALENLIQKMAKHKKVIILSGDVHYGFSSALDYWEGSVMAPKARFVQLTSSSLKNEAFGFAHLYRSALAGKVITGVGNRLDKVVWINKVLSVSGNVSVRNRNRIRQSPAVVPTAGWQPGATVSQPPDYRYRITVQTDQTAHEGDPVEADLIPENENSMKEGYKKIAQRHLDNFISGVHRSMVWPSNIGLITFEPDGESWKVKHTFLYAKGNRDISKKDVGKHIVHTIPLKATGDDAIRPELG